FDANGWLYFTGEQFDLLYPSYGDTYPTYMGAIGMTYEQAGQSGLGIANDEGIILTLKDRLEHHFTTGLSTVEMASKNAKKLNAEFRTFFTSQTPKFKSYILRGSKDKLNALKSLLDQHEIAYGMAENTKILGFDYSTGNNIKYTTQNNDLVVS